MIKSEINDFLVLGDKVGLYRKFKSEKQALIDVLCKVGLEDRPGTVIIHDEPGIIHIPVELDFDNPDDNLKAADILFKDGRFCFRIKSMLRGER